MKNILYKQLTYLVILCSISFFNTVNAQTKSYQFEIKTYDDYYTGTAANIWVSLEGSITTSEEVNIKDKGDYSVNSKVVFSLTLADVGELEKLNIRQDNSGSSPGWKISYIKIKVDGDEYTFSKTNFWLNDEENMFAALTAIPNPNNRAQRTQRAEASWTQADMRREMSRAIVNNDIDLANKITNSDKNFDFLANSDLLDYAIQQKSEDVFNILIENNAVPSDASITHVLHNLPSIEIKKSMISKLVEKGAKPSEQDAIKIIGEKNNDLLNVIAEKYTASNNAINLAIKNRDNDILNTLIEECKGRPSLENLQNAIRLEDTKILNSLLEVSSLKPTTAELKMALATKNEDMINGLLEKVKPDSEMMVTAIKEGNTDLITKFLDKTKPDEAAFIAAAERNNTDIFRILVDEKSRPLTSAPIKIAVEKGNAEILTSALEDGDGNATEALNNSLTLNKIEMAKICLENKADPKPAIIYAVNKEDQQFLTYLLEEYPGNSDNALELSVAKNNLVLVQTALNNGAKPNNFIKSQAEADNEEMVKVLMNADGSDPDLAMLPFINKGNASMIEFLIEKGAKADEKAYLEIVAATNNLELAELLISNGAKADYGLIPAIQNDQQEIVVLLLENNHDQADPNKGIELAAERGSNEIVKLLLDKDADPNKGITSAVNASHVSTVQLLLEKGADTKGQLSVAAGNGSLEICKLLVENEEYPASPNEGMSNAVNGNHTQIVKYLLEKEADPNGFINVPASRGNAEMVSEFLKYEISPEEGLQSAVNGGHANVVKVLVDAGADGSKQDYLTTAIKSKFGSLVELLIANGISIDYKEPNGYTYLHIAVIDEDNTRSVQALINAGHEVNIADNEGNTPLHLAGKEGKDNLDTVKTLLNAGADANLKNKDGKTPRKVAKSWKVKRQIKKAE